MRVNVFMSNEIAYTEAETCLVVPLYERDFPLRSEALTAEDELILQALADKDVFSGKAEECYYLPRPGGAYKGVLIAGLGRREACTAEQVRRTAGAACALFKQHRVSHVYLDASHFDELPAGAFLEGVVLGQYDFDVYRKRKDDVPAPVKVEEQTVIVSEASDVEALRKEFQLAVLIALSTNGARHLANTAPNEMTPVALAEFALGVARETACECTILEERQMAALGMNALLGVARGSAQPPRLIVLHHRHSEAAKTIAIVGKGVTFDTGGISIKPAADMHEMKYDMAGAAAVLCTMMNIVELKPAINVVCVVPAVENMPGAAAMRPGDIVTAYNGKSIEVRNTDAEGRLILADAIAYAVDKYQPACVVDLATLTGACVVALGHCAAGIFGNDQALVDTLIASGEATGDRLWQLPLWPEYEKDLESPHADLSNVGPRWGGAITAATFIKNFVGETPWAHLDIAGTAWGGKHQAYLDASHATGFGVRLLTKWILDEGSGGTGREAR